MPEQLIGLERMVGEHQAGLLALTEALEEVRSGLLAELGSTKAAVVSKASVEQLAEVRAVLEQRESKQLEEETVEDMRRVVAAQLRKACADAASVAPMLASSMDRCVEDVRVIRRSIESKAGSEELRDFEVRFAKDQHETLERLKEVAMDQQNTMELLEDVKAAARQTESRVEQLEGKCQANAIQEILEEEQRSNATAALEARFAVLEGEQVGSATAALESQLASFKEELLAPARPLTVVSCDVVAPLEARLDALVEGMDLLFQGLNSMARLVDYQAGCQIRPPKAEDQVQIVSLGNCAMHGRVGIVASADADGHVPVLLFGEQMPIKVEPADLVFLPLTERMRHLEERLVELTLGSQLPWEDSAGPA